MTKHGGLVNILTAAAAVQFTSTRPASRPWIQRQVRCKKKAEVKAERPRWCCPQLFPEQKKRKETVKKRREKKFLQMPLISHGVLSLPAGYGAAGVICSNLVLHQLSPLHLTLVQILGETSRRFVFRSKCSENTRDSCWFFLFFDFMLSASISVKGPSVVIVSPLATLALSCVPWATPG